MSEDYDQTETERSDIKPDPPDAVKWVSAIVALVGVWLLGEAYLLEPIFAGISSDSVVGVALLALGGYNYIRRSGEWFGSVGVSALVILLGVWLVASPFLGGQPDGPLALADNPEFWSDVVTGLVTVTLGIYSLSHATGTTETTDAAPQ